MREDLEAEDSGIDWLFLLTTVYSRKWAILSLALVVTLVTAVVVFSMTPIYSASALVHIESRQANIVSIEELYRVESRDQGYYNTQAEILQSRPIAVKVIEAVGVPLEVESSGIASFFSFDWRALLPLKPPEPPGGSIEFSEQSEDVDNYLEGLWIQRVAETELVVVGYVSEDPRLAMQYANAHVAAYMESIIETRQSATELALSWMGERVAGLRKNLLDSEAELQAFREQEKLIDSEGYRALQTQEVNDLSTRLVNARRKLAASNIAYQQVYGNDSAAIESVPAVLENAAAQDFRSIQALAEQEVAEAGKVFGPKHPVMIAAQSKLTEATRNLDVQRQSIAGGIRAEYLAAQAEVAALENDLADAKQQYQELTRKGSNLASLQQEVDTNRELYELFYGRVQETALTADLQAFDATVVEPAVVPREAISPNKSRAVVLAFLLSLLAGICLAFLLEQFNNKIRNVADVEAKIGLPLLGLVPKLSETARTQPALALHEDGEHRFGESIRTILTAISLSSFDRPQKVLLVTSSVGGEGKSTLAMNLAMAIAPGEKVLLLEADMRRPSVALNLNLDPTRPGLSELLAQQAGIEDCVTTLEDGGLDVLTSGTIPPEPLRLLSSSAFTQLIVELRDTYDRVIIDGPPVLGVSDSAVLSTHADSLVYVIKADATPVRQIGAGIGQLQRFSAPMHAASRGATSRRATDYFAGVVVNQIDMRKATGSAEYGY
ncbi:polysaccharide biosynthesis tyrosine autokinase [Halieaceae bacterium IMCC14734]|uniref:non-specific protein-tyrosine kinase n=1 Tax=Candidatus Litorirhabdus singularis TaxID=2518993 RepID=A0ABT3TJY5_9GAMM|nr:polysaccharide biosynthesis tyrosine autokinase [Candidatus Litorirhabdus singularis]MCX2982100.1 polysaccharide biosynthesis tyrosine autokinase [Candidatus Litorirhabdus singularis]